MMMGRVRRNRTDTLYLVFYGVIGQLFQFGLQPVAIAFAGRLGKTELDAVGLATSMINILGQVTVMGMATAAETLFTQCYGGENKREMGIALQRALLIQLLSLAPVCSVFINMETILVVLGQDAQVSKLVARYLILFIPGLLFLFLYYILRRYMECKNIVLPQLLIGGTCFGLNVFLQWLFVYELQLGFEGSALSQDLTFFLLFLLTFLYMYCMGIHKEDWDGWSWDSLRGWSGYMRLAMPGYLMIGFSWWTFELTIFLAGLLGTTELAAQTVMAQLDIFQNAVGYGIGAVVAMRVGHGLGAGLPLHAKTSAYVAATCSLISSSVYCILFLTTRNVIPHIFTDVPEVISLVSQLVPMISLYTFFDGFSQLCKGMCRGAGKQFHAAVVVLACFIGLGIPLAVCLTFFTPLRIMGMWWGYSAGLIAAGLVFLLAFVFWVDWQALATEAKERLVGYSGAFHEDIIVEFNADENTPLLGHDKEVDEKPDKSPKDKACKRANTLGKESIKVLIIKRLAVLLLLLAIFGMAVFISLEMDMLVPDRGEKWRHNRTSIDS